MPLLKLQFNGSVANSTRQELLKTLSSTVASALGKPESYMMVVLEQAPIYFDKSAEPAALFEVRSVGQISEDQAKAISEQVSIVLRDQLQIDPSRVYSNYIGVQPSFWGHNSATFG